jgi:phage-related protein
MPGRKIGDAFLALHPEVSGPEVARVAANAGKDFGDQFTRGVDGRLRDSRGRFVKTLDDSVGSASTSSGSAHGKLFGTSFVSAAVGLMAGVSVFNVLKDSLAEARESVRVTNLTEAAIRSTGGAAKISAGQIGELATALSNKVGVDDEAIQTSENLLLTFTQVRNEAGRGNDVFDQASAAIVDMTAAMNGGVVTQEGLKASTIQVGKALQDPINGATALRRVGVALTEQQQAQIKAFVASGNIMGAQKVILKELTTEFGGAAAAAADPAQRMQVVWKNFQEMIGGFVLPALATLGAFLGGVILPLIQNQIIPRIRDLAGWLKLGFIDGTVNMSGLAGGMEVLGVAVRGVWGWVRTTGIPAAKEFLNILAHTVGVIADIVIWFNRHRAAAIALGTAVGALVIVYQVTNAVLAIQSTGWAVYLGITNAVRIATVIWTGVQWLLNAAFYGFPLVWIVAALAAVVVWIILAIKYHKQIADFIVMVWNHIWAFCADIIGRIGGWIARTWSTAYEDTVRFFQGIAGFVVNIWNTVYQNTVRFFQGIVGFFVNVWNTIYQNTARWVGAVANVIAGIAGAVYGFLKPAIDFFVSVWNTAWSMIKLAAQVGWAVIQIIFALIRIWFGTLIAEWRLFAAGWSMVWGAITGAAGAAWGLVRGWFTEIYDWVTVRLVAGVQFLRGIWDLVWSAVSNTLGIIGAAIRVVFTEIYDWVGARLVAGIQFLRSVWELVWSTISDALSRIWAAIRAVFNEIVGWVEDRLVAAFTFYRDRVLAVWNDFRTGLSVGWNWIRDNIFNPISSFVTQTLPDAFSRGVDAIGRWWDGLKEKAKIPVKFVIDTVINAGILGGLRWIVDKLGISNVHIDDFHPPGFAGGGWTGPGGKHQPAGIVHADEFVIPKEVVGRFGVGFFDALIGKPASRYPGDTSQGISIGIGYADGGIVAALSGAVADIFRFFTNPAGVMKDALNSLVNRIPGGGDLHDVLAGAGHKMVDWAGIWLVDKVGSLLTGVSGGNLATAWNLLLAAVGKPYGWGQAGPELFDCSGALSMVFNALHGRPPYVHTFSTSDEAGFFPIPGVGGVLTAGWTNPGESGPGGDSVGHTAGLLRVPGTDPTPFESTGGVGVRIGAGVTPVGTFAHVGHFDRGGWLNPGWNAMYNGTGRGEYLRPDGEPVELGERTVRALAAAIAAGVGGEINGVGRSVTQMARAY